jgi:isopenicillin-N N-acyltransferase-like protein
MKLLRRVVKVLAWLLVLLLVVVVGVGLYANSRTVSSGDDYAPSVEEQNRLAALNPVTEGNITRLGQGRLERRSGNLVLFLKGSPYEMGYQHGRLLKDEIHSGTAALYRDPVSMEASLRDKPVWLKSLLLKYLEYKVYGPIERNTPPEYLAELKGMADGADISFHDMFIASFFSDLTMAMVPGVITKKAKTMGLVGECSSMAVSGPATIDGKLLFGRNTDYSGQGRWGPNQTVVFYQPDQGYRYVKVSTAGLIKCNSAMNEKGLVVGGHFMGFDGSDPAGESFSVLENEIMRKAATLDQALELLKTTRRGGSFGLVVADGNSGQAAAVEATSRQIGIRMMKDHAVALTNCATTPELKSVDLVNRYNVVMRDVFGRLSRLTAMIQEHFGKLDPETVAAVMSDQTDAVTNTERGAGFSVCSPVNVTSAVFQPSTGFFWAATGSEPACGNTYIGFDFQAELNGKSSQVMPKTLDGYQWQNPDRQKALAEYMAAFITMNENPKNLSNALDRLAKAMAIDPDEPTYFRTAALFYLRQGKYKEAEKVLARAASLPQSPNELAFTHLLSAWTSDLSDNREKALAEYENVFKVAPNPADSPLRAVNPVILYHARQGQAAPFTQDGIKEIPLKFHPATNFE